MSKPSHEAALIGIGIDVGGSGLRAASWTRVTDGWRLGASVEGVHRGSDVPARIADAARAVARRRGLASASPIALGVAAPGRKTTDGRGIADARNLPADPDWLGRLDDLLDETFRVPARLTSDAEAALVGERVVANGALVGHANALYLGPGTGLGVALLHEGVPHRVPRDRWNHARAGTPVEDAATLAAATRAPARFRAALAGVLRDVIGWATASRVRPDVVLVRSRSGAALRAVEFEELEAALDDAAQRAGVEVLLEPTVTGPHVACAGALALEVGQIPAHPGGVQRT